MRPFYFHRQLLSSLSFTSSITHPWLHRPHQPGDVLLFSTRTLTVANIIQVHKSPLSFLSINSTSSLLATSSDKGTVIRVWSIPVHARHQRGENLFNGL
ncbi:hypothetical protein BYT27DRAFT_7181857 [Phlegmacium glaucopus]|nr:hypothetical protein BYT27DRAFT_7181857 [Phlegmacium glaucopus]